MDRRQVLLSVVGLALTTATAQAAAPPTVTILKQEYNVAISKRVGTFKNGVTVNRQTGTSDEVPDEDVYKRGALAFVPGGNPDGSQDRLFVSAPHQDNPTVVADGLYILTGAVNQVFSPANSDANVLLRGNKQVTGRFQNLTFLNDTDTGVGKDRNLYGYGFTECNMMRWLDLGDLLKGAPHTEDLAFRNLSVFRIIEFGLTEETFPPDPTKDEQPDDPNMPAGAYLAGALTPNGMMINVARGSDLEFGVIDPNKGTTFFPVKTALAATAAADQFDLTEIPISFARLQGDEYLLVGVGTEPNGPEANLVTTTLYHLKITLPADLTKEALDSIKIELLGKEDLMATKLGQTPTQAMAHVAIGRTNAAGKPTLYMTDWDANILTLTPK